MMYNTFINVFRSKPSSRMNNGEVLKIALLFSPVFILPIEVDVFQIAPLCTQEVFIAFVKTDEKLK